MKIAHYTYDNVKNPLCGGGGAFRELMINTLIARTHTVYLYSGNYRGSRNESVDGVTVRHLGLPAPYILSRITYSIAATIHSLFVSADVIVIGYSVFSPVLGFLIRRKRSVLLFYHLTGMEPFKKYSIFGVLPFIAERLALRAGKNFITLTDSMQTYILSNYKNKNVRAAYTGYEESMLSRNRHDDNYILCFGRIDIHMKGIDILLDAFDTIAANFASHRLIIAGRGNFRDVSWVKNRMARSPFSGRLELKENVSSQEKKQLFEHATFVCMPSRFEGWCICAIEAAACSKATIGTKIMGLQDSIRDNETGLLVPSEDSDALSQKMALLLTDASLRNELGENGYAWAQHFTWERVTGLELGFYEEVRRKLTAES